MVDWKRVEHFEPSEFGKNADMLDARTIYILDAMRHEEDIARRKRGEHGIIVTINEAFALRPKNPKSYHPKGKAIDFVIRDAISKEPLDVFEQFLITSRYFFCGIGFYPFWEDPGIHGDTRPLSLIDRRATWWRDEDGSYLLVNQYLVRRFGNLWN